MANELEQQVLKKAQTWLDGNYDEATKKQVKYLISARAACAGSWAWARTA